MMKTSALYLLSILFFFGSCASTESVLSEFDETVSFDDYTTFVLCVDDLFVENTQFPKYDNNFIRELISEELESQMISRGHRTNVLNPELQVGFELIVEEKEATFKNCDVVDEYQYWKECTIDTIVYTEETVVIFVSDMARNQIIWQASVQANLNKPKTKLKDYIKELIERMFNEYPKVS